MMLQRFFMIYMVAMLAVALPHQLWADNLALPDGVTKADIKADLPQPYVVKKGDTLWDIANYFFKDPHKWLKIWERNLYITNPDLIYPGNEIWFDAKKKKQGGLTKVRPQPAIVAKPVERLEAKIDTSLLLTALARQDFVSPEAIDGVGYILGSQEERINYGANDHVYIKMKQAAHADDIFDVFRTGDSIYDPDTGDLVGVLVEHLGKVKVTSQASGVYRGLITETFEEISRGDRLKPAKDVNTRITPSYPKAALNGKVLYIRNNAAEAGQNQVIGISLGIKDGMKAGTVLSVYRKGGSIEDKVTGEEVQLPDENIGDVMVLVAQQKASLALLTRSSSAVNIGDAVRNQVRR